MSKLWKKNSVVEIGVEAKGCSSIQGPVVQSVVSLTSWLRVISLTVLADQYTIF